MLEVVRNSGAESVELLPRLPTPVFDLDSCPFKDRLRRCLAAWRHIGALKSELHRQFLLRNGVCFPPLRTPQSVAAVPCPDPEWLGQEVGQLLERGSVGEGVVLATFPIFLVPKQGTQKAPSSARPAGAESGNKTAGPCSIRSMARNPANHRTRGPLCLTRCSRCLSSYSVGPHHCCVLRLRMERAETSVRCVAIRPQLQPKRLHQGNASSGAVHTRPRSSGDCVLGRLAVVVPPGGCGAGKDVGTAFVSCSGHSAEQKEAAGFGYSRRASGIDSRYKGNDPPVDAVARTQATQSRAGFAGTLAAPANEQGSCSGSPHPSSPVAAIARMHSKCNDGSRRRQGAQSVPGVRQTHRRFPPAAGHRAPLVAARVAAAPWTNHSHPNLPDGRHLRRQCFGDGRPLGAPGLRTQFGYTARSLQYGGVPNASRTSQTRGSACHAASGSGRQHRRPNNSSQVGLTLHCGGLQKGIALFDVCGPAVSQSAPLCRQGKSASRCTAPTWTRELAGRRAQSAGSRVAVPCCTMSVVPGAERASANSRHRLVRFPGRSLAGVPVGCPQFPSGCVRNGCILHPMGSIPVPKDQRTIPGAHRCAAAFSGHGTTGIALPHDLARCSMVGSSDKDHAPVSRSVAFLRGLVLGSDVSAAGWKNLELAMACHSDQDVASLPMVVSAGLGWRSIRRYAIELSRFVKFWQPFTPSLPVALSLVDRHAQQLLSDRRPSAWSSLYAGLNWIHATAGLQSPLRHHPSADALIKAILRQLPGARRRTLCRRPILPLEVLLLLEEATAMESPTWDAVRCFVALLYLSFSRFWRTSRRDPSRSVHRWEGDRLVDENQDQPTPWSVLECPSPGR